MKKRLQLLVGILVSLLFLYLAMRDIVWADLWATFKTANYLYLIPALLLLVVTNWIRAYRWRLLMTSHEDLSIPRVFWMVMIGYFFNNTLPAKAGELVRAYLAGRSLPGGIGEALSGLLIERLLDVLAVVVLLVLLVPFVAVPAWVTQGGLVFGSVAIVGTIVLFVLAKRGPHSLDGIWRWVERLPLASNERLSGLLGKLRRFVENLIEGFGVLSEGRRLVRVLLSSAAVWLGYALLNYTMLFAFGLSDQPFSAAALVLCATGLSMVVPSSPGAMGVFEWAAVLALAVFGVAEAPAFGYAFGLHIFTNLVLILFGLVGLLVLGVSASTIRQQAMQQQHVPAKLEDETEIAS